MLAHVSTRSGRMLSDDMLVSDLVMKIPSLIYFQLKVASTVVTAV